MKFILGALFLVGVLAIYNNCGNRQSPNSYPAAATSSVVCSQVPTCVASCSAQNPPCNVSGATSYQCQNQAALLQACLSQAYQQ